MKEENEKGNNITTIKSWHTTEIKKKKQQKQQKDRDTRTNQQMEQKESPQIDPSYTELDIC